MKEKKLLLFAALLLILACNLPPPSARAPAIVISTITPSQSESGVPEVSSVAGTPTRPPSPTPLPPQGAPTSHLSAGQVLKITDIHMANGSNGWAIGGVDGKSNHIVQTADGGLTWADVTPPEPASDNPQNPKEALGFFLDSSNAWVTYYLKSTERMQAVFVWRTHDGGSHWQYDSLTRKVPVQGVYQPSDLFFLDAQHGWMIAHVGGGMNHDYYALLSTSDGGANWKTLLGPVSDASGTQSCAKTGLDFATPQVGWMGINCLGVVPVPYFFKTGDGGYIWERVELPPPPSAPDIFNQDFCSVDFPTLFTATHGDFVLACARSSNGTLMRQSFLYETTDDMANWNVYPYPGGSLQFVDTHTAFALGRDIQRSDNAGHTWTYAKTVNWDGQFSFIDANTAWAVATNQGQIALVKTIDGGMTWQEIKPVLSP